MKETHCLEMFALLRGQMEKKWKIKESHFLGDGIMMEVENNYGELFNIKISPKEIYDETRTGL